MKKRVKAIKVLILAISILVMSGTNMFRVMTKSDGHLIYDYKIINLGNEDFPPYTGKDSVYSDS